LGKIVREGIRAGVSLLETLKNTVPEPFNSYESAHGNQNEISEIYKIRVKTKEEAKKIGDTINKFCAPHIQNWWLDTQDKLVREGNYNPRKAGTKNKR
jgi:hypothetical protein